MDKKQIIAIVLISVIILVYSNSGKKEGYSGKSTLTDCNANRQDKISAGYACVASCFKMTQTIADCFTSWHENPWYLTIGTYYFMRDNNGMNCYQYIDDEVWGSGTPQLGAIAAYKCIPGYNIYAPQATYCDREGCIIGQHCANNVCVEDTCSNPSGAKNTITCISGDRYVCSTSLQGGVWGTTWSLLQDCGVQTCSNGLCVASCNTAADTDCNNDVSDSELLAYSNKWLMNQVTDAQLLQAAQAWLIG